MLSKENLKNIVWLLEKTSQKVIRGGCYLRLRLEVRNMKS